MSEKKTLGNSRGRKQEEGSVPDVGSQRLPVANCTRSPVESTPRSPRTRASPLSDNQNSLRANPRGPTLLEDFILREKIMHFDHERIPERIVHARGTGVHGFFELTASLEQYTTARILTEVGEKTPVFARFSTVAGGAGSVDTPRDVRGFAVKFYTKEGNWDLVGNNIPVFFIQDAIKFPDLIHAVKMEPDRGFPQSATAHDTFWDFISLTPESMHMVMWIMSDRTIPRSLRMIEGFGVHSFRLINDAGESTFVKFHWRPKLGLQSTIWDEAVKIAGADPDFHRRDMFEAITAGNFPEWEFAVQLFTQEEADKIPVRSSGRDQADSRRTGALESDRPHGAGSLAGQFLRRNRAGRLLPRAISCRASISRTIRCCRAACSPISTRSFRAWARPISTRSRSTRPSARSPTSSATGTCRWRNRRAVLPTSPTPCPKTRRAKRRPRAFAAPR